MIPLSATTFLLSKMGFFEKKMKKYCQAGIYTHDHPVSRRQHCHWTTDFLCEQELESQSPKQTMKTNVSLVLSSSHCQFSEFSFTFIFCYFCWDFQHYITCSKIFFEITMFSSKKFSFHKSFFFNFFIQLFFLKFLIASYGARVLGSVFKMDSRAFSREFEYIETSPGFAQLLKVR